MTKQTLKFKAGDRVDYYILDKKYFTGTITEAEEKKGKKPYTILTDDGATKYANEDFLFYSPLIEIYKGYEIRTTPNGTHSTSLIYKNGEAVGGSFAGPFDKITSTEKAKIKIDVYGN